MIKFKDVQPKVIHVSPEGWEVIIDEQGFHMPTRMPREAKKNARLYWKGLKILFKEASKCGFFEGLGGSIHGNNNTVEEKFNKLQSCGHATIIQIGMGARYTVESYVDGSYTVSIL